MDYSARTRQKRIGALADTFQGQRMRNKDTETRVYPTMEIQMRRGAHRIQ